MKTRLDKAKCLSQTAKVGAQRWQNGLPNSKHELLIPELAEYSDDDSEMPEPATSTSNHGSHIFKWKPTMLAIFFCGPHRD
jgi:hypothetical protein